MKEIPDKKIPRPGFQEWLWERLEPKQSYKDLPDYVDAWFLVPSGLISGKVEVLLSSEVLTLSDVHISMGNKSVKVKEATVSLLEVIAWGVGIPMFIEEPQALLTNRK